MLDIHTHNPAPAWPAIVHVEATPTITVDDLSPIAVNNPPYSAETSGSGQASNIRYSLGVHPWNADADDTRASLGALRRIVPEHPATLAAIGECGLDRLRGPALDVQQRVFMAQARLAAEARLPLIIHCVRAWAELLALRKKIIAENPAQPPRWIVHGFRGNQDLARQLVTAGIELSFGEHFNPSALAAVPPAMRHSETDDSPLSLPAILTLHSSVLSRL